MHRLIVKEGNDAMRIKVVVAFGGESVEHEISILSAHQVMQAMNPMKYEVIPLYLIYCAFGVKIQS